RARRDALLRASDWTQLPDSPLSQAKRDEYRAHRQALRDITEEPAWPDVTLPEPPTP
ncbi:MAG: phage tail assembly chaperone, partial [Gammaproteobacteria bacterium]|nr:phage tail assembly chaperone [Gammaproteobacteria bacterium]